MRQLKTDKEKYVTKQVKELDRIFIFLDKIKDAMLKGVPFLCHNCYRLTDRFNEKGKPISQCQKCWNIGSMRD